MKYASILSLSILLAACASDKGPVSTASQDAFEAAQEAAKAKKKGSGDEELKAVNCLELNGNYKQKGDVPRPLNLLTKVDKEKSQYSYSFTGKDIAEDYQLANDGKTVLKEGQPLGTQVSCNETSVTRSFLEGEKIVGSIVISKGEGDALKVEGKDTQAEFTGIYTKE